MTALWSLLSPFLAPILKALGALGLYFKGRSDARVQKDLQAAKVELEAARKAADARKRVVAADDAERHRLRVKYTRPE